MTKQVYRADIRPYQDRIAALEAELEAFRGKPSGKDDVATAVELLHEWKARAEKAEAEVDHLRSAGKLCGHGCEVCNARIIIIGDLKAEVERLNWMLDVHGCDRRCGGRKSLSSGKASGKTTDGVSPSPPRGWPYPMKADPKHGWCEDCHHSCPCGEFCGCLCCHIDRDAAEPAAPRHYMDCICVECEAARKEAAKHAAHALCWDEPCPECEAEDAAAAKAAARKEA